MKKAYKLSSYDPDDGDRLVFSENANKARAMGASLFGCGYLDVRAYRVKNADQFIDKAIDDELDWNNEVHRDILERVLGWQEVDG